MKGKRGLTSSVTGPDDGVASPMPFVGVSLLHSLNLNSVARPGARGVGWCKSCLGGSVLKQTLLCLLIVTVSVVAQEIQRKSPNGQHTIAVVRAGGPTGANEDTISFLSSEGRLLLKKSFASKDGQHGYSIIRGQWSSDSMFYAFCMASSGGHQPWHVPTSVYSVATNQLYCIDDLFGSVTTSGFKFLAPGSLETKILDSSDGREKTIVVKLSELSGK
jgi:hypothetical protein